MAKQERLGSLFIAFSGFGALVALIRACQLYGQGTLETVNSVVYIAVSLLCTVMVVREAVLFLKERKILN